MKIACVKFFSTSALTASVHILKVNTARRFLSSVSLGIWPMINSGRRSGIGCPSFAAVMTGKRNRQYGNTQRRNMLGDADAGFFGIAFGQIRICFGTIGGKNKLIFIRRAAMDHHYSHVRDRNSWPV